MSEEFGDCAQHSEYNIPDPENQAQFEILLCNGLLVVCTCVAGHARYVVICDFYSNCRPFLLRLKGVVSEMCHLAGE